MAPQIRGWRPALELGANLCSCYGLVILVPLGRIPPQDHRRCWKTTAITAPLLQSARCQLPWHVSIQSVARPQRSGGKGDRRPGTNRKPGNWLVISPDGARVLLSDRAPGSSFLSPT